MHTMCKIDEVIVIPNFAALRAAVFPLFAKNLRGADIRPPPSVRGLTRHRLGYFRTHDSLGGGSDPTPPPLLSREPMVVSSPARRRSKGLYETFPKHS